MKTRIALAAVILLGASLTGCMGTSVAPWDNTAPAAPQGLTLVTGQVSPTLQWQPNSESDVIGYEVYRVNIAVGQTSAVELETSTPITENTYPVAAGPGQWQYTVRAVDAIGHRSPPATVTVDLQNPTSPAETPTPDEGVAVGKRG